ncbi:Ig-like domain-containing protein [Methanobrevibacter thaueri]|uniref:Putative outer membrane protein pmp18 n=1 Tax=Methanobrevibacter thaueri TaxID=190975 RepID=A0A315XLW5_9EURY|nr:Ig-like domain-containing protein [Methanobrevibacter thaueri]PWB85516.1 putative outer membrane protein pmp18 precursor [Methanobrevibacter thaueri]
MKFKEVFKLLILLCFVVSIAGVSAVDCNDTGIDDSDLCSQNMIDDTSSSNIDDFKLKDDKGNFSNLVSEIGNARPGDVISLDNDYYVENETSGIIINCDNVTIDGRGFTFYGGEGIKDFSLITVHGSNVVLRDIVFNSFRCGESGHLIDWYGTQGNVSSCSFYNNFANYGGVIDWSGSSGHVEYCEFLDNFAFNDGGAIYAIGNGFNLYMTYFDNNSAEVGGAVYVNGKNYRIDYCQFINNSASNGGAVHGSEMEGMIVNCYFYNNTADIGGAIECISDNSQILNSTFEDNNASEGGAIYLEGSDAIISNNTFVNNGANLGGAIEISNNRNSTINASRFYDNHAEIGGAICSDDENCILDCLFDGNTASFGGAIYSEVVSIEDSIFTNNEADSYGGAVFIGEVGEIFKSVFNNNSAEIAGAIFFEDFLNISDSEFGDNVGKLFSSNNVISDRGVIILNNITSDSPIFLKSVEINFAGIENNVYGSMLSISFNVTNQSGIYANPNATVLLKINGNVYYANASDGNAVFKISNLDAGEYKYVAVYKCPDFVEYELYGNFTVNPLKASITAKTASFVINYGGKYSITLKDEKGNFVPSQTVTFVLNGKTIGSAKTNSKGVATIKLTSIALKTAKAGSKKLVIKVKGKNCKVSDKTVNVKINKEKVKIISKKKSFKRSQKTKKYVVTLKNTKGKAIKKAKVTLKVKGKKYKAKTNSKGKATFKVKKLTKKGKYKATIKFSGNKYYKKASKKVKITVKK